MRWWRKHSLRSRLVGLSVAALAVGFAVGGAVLVVALAITLQRSADAEAQQTATDVARLVEEDALPEPVPVAGEQLVQVVDAQGRVLSASIGADRLVPMVRERERPQLRDGGRMVVDGERIGVRGPVRITAVPANGSTVLVARPIADLRESVQKVRTILLIAFPVLVVGLAVVMWRVVGATLRPVEALRAGAAEITVTGRRPARLPEPAAHDEIHRLAVTLNDMLGRLEAARERQRAFVADAAHELRSPLANMRTELEVAQRLQERDPAATDWSELSQDLLTDAQRLARLVDDLLLLARVDDSLLPERATEPVELGGLIAAVAQRYPSQVCVIADGPFWTEGAPEELRRVVANLLDNAVRHAQSRVTVAVAREGAHHLVSVTDDGPGIPEADRHRVFDRFTRLDDARNRDAGGAGLGLSIVRDLVRRHGGTVRLRDAPGGTGLRAEVRLPTGRPPAGRLPA